MGVYLQVTHHGYGYLKADLRRKPVPTWQEWVLMGMGTGTAKNTHGLPRTLFTSLLKSWKLLFTFFIYI